MSARLLVMVVMATAVASAQQGSAADSGAAKTPQAGTSQPAASQQNPPVQDAAAKGTSSDSSSSNSSAESKTAPKPAQPPASELSRDLTFPGDKQEPPPSPNSGSPKAPDLTPPRSDRVRAGDLGNNVGESSSKDTQIDLSAPEDDTKVHPQSSAAVASAEASSSGISEFHTWDPHKAAKSVEVGDFYFRRKNYRAAEDRYREALRYKDNDAVATIRLAVSLEKLGEFDDACSEYESYLRILPHGPQAEEARKAIARLNAPQAAKGEAK